MEVDTMKKLEDKKGLFTIVMILVTIVMAMIIYPLFDLILSNFTNEKFEYSITDHVVSPIVFGVTFGLVYSLLYFRKKK